MEWSISIWPKIRQCSTLCVLVSFLMVLVASLVMHPFAVSAAPAPNTTQNVSAAEHTANARKTDADARKSNADADKTIAETKRAEVDFWFGDISAFFLKVLLPLIALIVILSHLKGISAFLASRAWNVTAPGGLSFGVTSAISAAITNATTNPPNTHVAAPKKIENATSTIANALRQQKTSLLRLSRVVQTEPDKQPSVVEAMNTQSDYFAQAYRGLLASQYALLKAAYESDGSLKMAEVMRIYHSATSNGLVLSLRDWLNYLVKWQFIKDPTDYLSGTTELTDLGNHFYQWMVANNHTPAELAAIGHGT